MRVVRVTRMAEVEANSGVVCGPARHPSIDLTPCMGKQSGVVSELRNTYGPAHQTQKPSAMAMNPYSPAPRVASTLLATS